MKKAAMSLAMVAMFVLMGCQPATPESTPAAETIEVAEESTTTAGRPVYDFETVKKGDVVGPMTVAEVGTAFINKPSIPFGIDNGKVSFEGKVTVSGQYHYYDDDDGMLTNIVCFTELDEKSSVLLPHAGEDERVAWFCFSNESEAKKAFAPAGSEGSATVVIDKYVDVSCGCAGFNKAELVEVVKKE